jgi:membrane protein
VQAWKWLLTFAKVTWGFCVSWLFMFAIYRLVPNTKVASRAAMIGGFVSALFLVIGKGSLGAYFKHALSLQSLYGQLGLIPLVMFWMYLMWLVILFGLEVSATVQTLAGRRLEELEDKRPQNGLVDPMSVLNMMEIITERFGQGLHTTARQIADETLVHESMVFCILDRLVERGVLHRVEGKEPGVTLARPPEQISGDALLEIGYSLADEGGAGRQSLLIQRLRDAQRNLAGQATLASILAQKQPIFAADQGSTR